MRSSSRGKMRQTLERSRSMVKIVARPARSAGARWRVAISSRARRLAVDRDQAIDIAACGQAMRGGRFKSMRRSNVALRLQESILEEARRVSETEGVALNQFINVAVAEKLSALRTEGYFREHGQRGDVARAKRLLKRAGRGNPPVAGDEVG